MQLRLFPQSLQRELARTEHGGDIRRGRRKLERPVSVRQPMHVTLHSDRARGDWSMLRHQRSVREALRVCAGRSGVKIYDFANVGTHLHLLVRARQRPAFQSFLRSFAGLVARAVTGARRGRPVTGGRFWSALAWSRVVTWGREYWNVRRYIFHNQIEATSGPGIRHAFEHGPPRE
jgi:REP element-mobilizing transposase RayT